MENKGIILKEHSVESPYTYINYKVSDLNNHEFIGSLCYNLLSNGITIKEVNVSTYSNSGERENDLYMYDSVEEYLKDYGKEFNDNTIESVIILCVKEKLMFKLEVNSKLKQIFVLINRPRTEDKFNLDNVVTSSMNYNRR